MDYVKPEEIKQLAPIMANCIHPVYRAIYKDQSVIVKQFKKKFDFSDERDNHTNLLLGKCKVVPELIGHYKLPKTEPTEKNESYDLDESNDFKSEDDDDKSESEESDSDDKSETNDLDDKSETEESDIKNKYDYYLVMEMIDGTDLSDYLITSHFYNLGINYKLDIFKEIIRSLKNFYNSFKRFQKDFDYASEKIGHGDFLPKNLIYKPNSNGYKIVIIDMGLTDEYGSYVKDHKYLGIIFLLLCITKRGAKKIYRFWNKCCKQFNCRKDQFIDSVELIRSVGPFEYFLDNHDYDKLKNKYLCKFFNYKGFDKYKKIFHKWLKAYKKIGNHKNKYVYPNLKSWRGAQLPFNP